MHEKEDALIEKVKKGDTEAFGELMELHMRTIRAYIALSAPVPHLIDEIAHEAFVYAYRHIEDFTTGTNFYVWVKAVARNILRSEIQRYARERSSRAGYVTFRLIQRSEDKSEEAKEMELKYLKDCIQEIPERQRALLDLKYGQNSTSNDIGRRMKKTTEWVRTTLFRIRRNLKKCIESKIPDRCRDR